jgi:multiple sugar transport system substrate-binding protein
MRILKPILIEFEKQHPDIKVELLHIPQNYFQKIHLLFASNTAPDVIFMNNQYLPIYANAGVLEDLSGYVQELEFDKFYPKALETLSWEGKTYGVPRDVSNLVIYYNKSLFDKKGVKYPKKGWTYEEFLDTAKRLTDEEVFGVSFEEEPLFYMPYLMTFGFKGVPRFEDEKVQKALEKYADLRHTYKVAPLKTDSASATMAQMFLQERLGMYISGRWMSPKLSEDAKFEWDVVEFPGVVPMDASGWVVAKSSKHKVEAVKLVKFLSSSDSLKEFTKSGLIVPARVDVAQSSVFLNGDKPKNAKVFLEVIETSKPTQVTTDYRQILDTLKTKAEYILN